MRDPEHYCWWCGTWQELPFLGAVCRTCNEIKGGDQHDVRWPPGHHSAPAGRRK
jgi:hypothetical protein